jgi:hypothetical protein
MLSFYWQLKIIMGSPNSKSKKSMPRPYKCGICGKSYAVNWAKDNHEKLCQENFAKTKNA